MSDQDDNAAPQSAQQRPESPNTFEVAPFNPSGQPPSGDDWDTQDGTFTAHRRDDMLHPGRYWRCLNDREVPYPGFANHSLPLHAQQIYLITDLVMFEDRIHSVQVLDTPSSGRTHSYPILVAEFLRDFEPVSDEDAKAARAAEMHSIMSGVSAMQAEMMQAQTDPLGLPGVREAAEEAVQQYEQEQISRVQAQVQEREKREADLRRIHRRAARRSAEKGNPIALRQMTLSNSVSDILHEGISPDGVYELTLEAGRHIARGEALSKWISARAKEIGRELERLTPFYTEQQKVALASAHKAIAHVKSLQEGIQTLRLYTGEGVDVVQVRQGNDAPSRERLTLLQGKRFADEELAIWADVGVEFDWRSAERFFTALRENDALLDQVLPAPRCVVTMAVTRRQIRYSANMHWYDRLMNDIANKAVFLLVRNGQNVHAVYSDEPSHEAAERLFPAAHEVRGHFEGLDGSTIGLHDVRFGKANADWESTNLHYTRLLILLCGLDHRERLFGDFYPREQAMRMLSLDFQRQYFQFVHDDEEHTLLGEGSRLPVMEWIAERNSYLRSGSRVAVAPGNQLKAVQGAGTNIRKLKPIDSGVPAQFVARASGGFHKVQIPMRNPDHHQVLATAWLDGPKAPTEMDTWFLCLDTVKLEDVSHYLHSRANRSADISWLRTLRYVQKVLEHEQAEQASLRAYLREAALQAQVLSVATVDQAIDTAIATWRADHGGADAPQVNETPAVNAILTLMYPSQRLGDELLEKARALSNELGAQPLRFSRTGKARFALYTAAREEDRAPYGSRIGSAAPDAGGTAIGACWGWVMRHAVSETRGKLKVTSSAPVWLLRANPIAAEETLAEWPEMEPFLNDAAEPTRLVDLRRMHEAVQESLAWEPVLSAGRAAPLRQQDASTMPPEARGGIPAAFMQEIQSYTAKLYAERTYFQDTRVFIPIGVVQRSAGGPVRYLYACASAPRVVHQYATAEQYDAFTRVVRRSPAAREALSTSPNWRVMTTSRPVSTLIGQWPTGDSKMETANWAEIRDTHAPGGLSRRERSSAFHGRSTRAQRRANGGDPVHQRRQHVQLCFNRAFDNLMGKSPEPRRSFYRSVESRVRSIFGVSDDSVPERRRLEREKRFQPLIPAAVSLSPLVWDARRARGMGNRLFPACKSE